jgi:phage host-nuclease inhibitor protein Gam
MRLLIVPPALGLLTLLAISCTATNDGHLTKDFKVVGQNVADASQDMKEYNFSEKDEFVRKMQIQMDDINRELDQLSMKIEKSDVATQTEDRPKLKALRDQMLVLNQQLEKAKTADATAWEDIKSGMKKGYADLKTGIVNARQWASEKIAP